jgi:ATP-dependent DNA ligase
MPLHRRALPACFIAPCLPTSAPQPPSGELRLHDDFRVMARKDGKRVKLYSRHDAGVFLYAFDLIELDGDDLRRDPLAVRKATLASLLARAAPGLRFNEHLDGADGPLVFAHACKLGLEGIVSRKNPGAPAVKREAGRNGAGDLEARIARGSMKPRSVSEVMIA